MTTERADATVFVVCLLMIGAIALGPVAYWEFMR